MMTRPEQILARLTDHLRSSDATHYPKLHRRAADLVEDIRRRSFILANPTPRIAFVAHKGVGKSTLINGLTGLWLEGLAPAIGQSGAEINKRSLLPLGTGGTTPCEVVIVPGEWSVTIEPLSIDGQRKHLEDFASWAWHRARVTQDGASVDERQDEEEESNEVDGGSTEHTPRLEPDIERVVRGLVALPRESTSVMDGTRRRTKVHDRAVELAHGFDDLRNFVETVVGRAQLETRTSCEFLPGQADPRAWLRHTLLELTKGKLPRQPFPMRVRIRAFFEPVELDGRVAAIVDTLGLPAVAKGGAHKTTQPLTERGYLRDVIKDEWTLNVVASQFNAPPAPSVELLKNMMSERAFFGDALADRTAVVIIDKGEAEANQFDPPDLVRQQKEEDCADQLRQLRCPSGGAGHVWSDDEAVSRVHCVNILGSGSDGLRSFLGEALTRLRASHERRLQSVVAEGEEFLERIDDIKAVALQEQIGEELDEQIRIEQASIAGPVRVYSSNVIKPYAESCKAMHHSTLRSMVRWQGEAPTANALAMLVGSTSRKVSEFVERIIRAVRAKGEALLRREQYRSDLAQQLVPQEVARRERELLQGLKDYAERLGEAAWACMREDESLWERCAHEWGKGPGYKLRVAGHFDAWGEGVTIPLAESLKDDTVLEGTGPLRSLLPGR